MSRSGVVSRRTCDFSCSIQLLVWNKASSNRALGIDNLTPPFGFAKQGDWQVYVLKT